MPDEAVSGRSLEPELGETTRSKGIRKTREKDRTHVRRNFSDGLTDRQPKNIFAFARSKEAATDPFLVIQFERVNRRVVDCKFTKKFLSSCSY